MGRPPAMQDRPRSALISVLLLILLAISEAATPRKVFVEAPDTENYYVWEGKEGPTLKCTVADEYRGDSFDVEWVRVTKGIPRTITRNGKLLDKKHFELKHDSASGRHDLSIKQVDLADTSGSFHCMVLDLNEGTQYTTDAAEVVVLVPPGDPVIVAGPAGTVTEGDGITFKCSSTGGSPTPSFQWYFHNDTAAPNELHTQQIIGDTVNSTIHWRATADDNNAFITCAVSNHAMEEGQEKKIKSSRLNVLFRPRVTVGPSSDFAVEAGKPVELSCSANANPSQPSFEWKHISTGQRYGSSKWPFVAEKAMGGEFECRATNTVGEGTDTLNLQVQYGPQIIVQDTVNPAEGDAVLVECFVDAFPSEESIEWSGPNGFTSRGSTLSIPSVTREQSGNYTCIATNHLTLFGETGSQPRVGRASTFVDVKRRPGRGVIEPWTLSVVAGGTIELNCDATDVGSPAASYKWSSPSSGGQFGTREHTRQKLVISNVQLADNGEYRCMPYNSIGEGESGVARVVVIEPASIARPMAIERIYTAGEKEQELSCEARGYPAPGITWTKDGLPLEKLDAWAIETVPGHSSCSPLDFCSVSVTSTLRWTRDVEWSDKGNYSCIASNGASEHASTWTLARVVHGPVILNERYPTEALAASDLKTTAMIVCRVSARPEPSFQWLYDSKELTEGGRFSIQVNREVERPDEYESILYISEVTESDYGRYVCRSVNGKGERAEVVIRLKEKGLPQAADKLQKISGTSTSLFMAWRPGFDGGYDQKFMIEYRRLNPFTELVDEEVFTLEVKNSTLRSIIVSDSSSLRPRRSTTQSTAVNLLTYNLTGLRPLSTYYVRVRSANKIGPSEFSPINIETTDDVLTRDDIEAPTSIDYIKSDGIFLVQPNTPPDSCMLMYVSTGDIWRSVDCYSADRTDVLPAGGDKFRARFCKVSQMGQITECSPVGRELVASMLSPPYRLAVILPIALLCAAILIVCSVIIFCCHCRGTRPVKMAKGPLALARGGKKKNRLQTLTDERPAVSGPLPPADAKNAPKNGSATDSGVFTLDSSNLAAKSPTKLYGSDRSANYSSNETGVDVWPPTDDGYHGGFVGDTYLAESYPAGNVFYSSDGGSPSGAAECPHTATTTTYDDDTDEAAYSGSRRVLREIIV